MLYLNINKKELPNDGTTRELNHRLKHYYANFEVYKKNYEIDKDILEPMLTNGLDYKKLTESKLLIEFRKWAIENCTTYNKHAPGTTTIVEKEDIKRYFEYKENQLVCFVETIEEMENEVLEKRNEYAKNRHNTEIH